MPRMLTFVAMCAVVASATAEAITVQRQGELLNLLYQDCGSCHGMRLTGGLGPPLTAQALRGKNHEFLTVTISEGRPGTPMPPWKKLLSKQEIAWIAEYLKTPPVAP